jgi:hypothetical protein
METYKSEREVKTEVSVRSPLRMLKSALNCSAIEEEEGEEEEENIFVLTETRFTIINLDCTSEISSRRNGKFSRRSRKLCSYD